MTGNSYAIHNVYIQKRPATADSARLLPLTGMAVAVTFVVVLVGLANGLSKSMLKLYVDRGVSLSSRIRAPLARSAAPYPPNWPRTSRNCPAW